MIDAPRPVLPPACLSFQTVALAPAPEPWPATKAAWRAVADARLRARPAQDRRAHALILAKEITALAQTVGARRVGLYSPIGAEVETRDLAYALRASGVLLAYPRLRSDGSTMEFADCAGPEALTGRPRSRLLEPTGAALLPQELDLVVVPSLALRSDLKRLGRGGGHFDRYLPTLAAHTLTIGSAAAATILDWSPVEGHDIALHCVCTEAGLSRAVVAP